MQNATVSKIQLPDGTICDLSHNQTVIVVENTDVNVTFSIQNFTGSVSLIEDQDYRLNISNPITGGSA